MSSYWSEQMKKSVEKQAASKNASGASQGNNALGYDSKTKNYWENLLGSGISLSVDSVNQWLSDVSSVTDELQNYKTAQGDKFTKNYGGQSASKIKELLAAGSDVQSFLNSHRDELSDLEGAQDALDSARKVLRAYDAHIYRKNSYFSQWDTEDSYNRDMQQSSWVKKYQGKGYQELVPLLEGLEDGEEKQWLTDYAGAVDYDERINMDLDAANQEIQDLETQLRNARTLDLEYKSFRENPLLMLTQGDTWRDLESRYDSFVEEYGGIEELESTIQQKRLRMAAGKQTQDDAKADAEYEEWKQNVRDSGTVQKELDKLNEALTLNEQAIRRYTRGSSQQDLALRAEADAQKKTLEQQKAALEKELQYSRMQDYAALMDRPDFAQNSMYVPTGDGIAVRDNATGQWVNTGFRDAEYDYINKNQKAQNYQFTVDSLQGIERMGMDRRWLLQMTDDEVKVYNYLYQTEGKDAAGEYLDVMRSELNRRQRAAEETQWAEYAQAHPFRASAASIVLAPIKAAGLVGQAIDKAADGKIDQNAAYNRASYISTAIRNEVSQIADEKWGPVGSFGYQTAMSMGDFLINGVAGGGLFGVPGVTMAIMGSGAAADTVISSKDRGLDDSTSFGLGIVAGLAEALTERFSLEALLDADLLKNGIGVYMLKNSMTEGSEEVASSIINLAADILVAKDKGEWREAIRKYQDQGYSEGEAFGKAMADQAASMGLDFLGGALSGGIMSGVSSAQYYADTKRTGKAMGRRGLTDTQEVQQILDAGANAEKGSAANEVAAQLQQKVDAGKQLSQYEKGRLYQSNPQLVSETVFGKGSVQLANPMVQGINSGDERWQQAQRLSSITGRDIKFYNGPENENGYFDKKTGEIYVNTNATDTLAQVVSHELTHSTELAESYEDLARFVRGKLKAEGKDWPKMIREKAEAYEMQGHSLESDADAEAEIIAEYVQNYLLTSEQEIFEAVWESPTLGQKILNWIDGILAKFNNQKAKERQMLHHAREIYARALEESRTGKSQQMGAKNNQGQYAPEEMEYMDQMYRDQYNRGEITEEEYDEYLAWRDHETASYEGEEELGRQYSIRSDYAQEIDQWNKAGRYAGETFTLGTTGDVLQGLGAVESDIYMQGDKINRILSDHPEMTLEEIKKVPQILEDPILILKSQNVGRGRSANTRMVIFGSIRAQNGMPVLTVLDLRPVENSLVIDDMQKVSSAYTKDYNPVGFVRNSEVLYADKKRTAKLLRSIGFQMPIELQQSGYIGSISYSGRSVNITGKKFREVAAEQKSTRQYSFAGEKAKTANAQKLQEAKTLKAEGLENETIRQRTGWFQGMDQKWRHEIDDSNMRVDRYGDARGAVSYKWALEDLETAREELFGSADLATLNDVRAYNRASIAGDETEMERLYDKLINGPHAYQFGIYAEAKTRVKEMSGKYSGVLSSGGQLADYVQHDALFEAYPQLREANFQFGNLSDGTRGQYDPSSNTITISDEIADAPERTIIHEIQHAIQKIEDFASGASPDYWKSRQQAGEHFGTYDRKIDEHMSYAQEILDSVPENIAEEFRDWYDLNGRDENAGIRRAQELEAGEYGKQFDDYFMTTWTLDELRKYNHDRGVNDLYQNTAGEIEARDTANRWQQGLDEEGRKNTPPNLGDERTVFAGNADWITGLDSEYSDRQNYVDADITSEETETGIHEVAEMAPVVKISGKEFAKGEVDLITQVEQFFAQLDNAAHNPQLGTVILDRKGVKSDIAHGIGRKKAAAFAAVPEVIEKGRVVDYQKNWKGRGYDTAVIAAPIEIGTEEHVAAVIVIRSRKTNLFYVHEVLTTKNGAMPFKTGARKSGVPSGDAPSIFSILDHIVEVKNNKADSSGDGKQFSVATSVGRTLNKRDVARDLRAILSRGGDPKELQQYVSRLEQNSGETYQNGTNRYQDREKRYQTDENRNSTAREILQIAHSQGQSVEEYLRWNPEAYEVDGHWRSEALEAIRMEQSGRQYSLNENKTAAPEAGEETENEESQARVIQRENLPTKAQSYLTRAENKLMNSIGKALSVPRYAQYSNLKGIIQEISDTYLTEGTVSDEKMSELFDKAYAEGIVADSAFYDQYKEIKDHLRTYGVTISDRDKSDIPNFEDFRKRAFGTIRILNNGGVPVDTAYQELQSMAPELFPDSITHPADQLVRMYEVGQSIAVSKKSLDEFYGPEKEEFRKWARNDFDAAVGEAFRDLRQVRRYAEDKSTQEEVKRILTVEDAEEAFQELKKLSRNVDKVRAKNLLTESDEILLGRILKGEIGLQHLNPNEDNVKGITAIYEAKLAYESQAEVLAAYKKSVKAKRLQEADRFLETAGSWKDKRAGILYARETMRRNIFDIVPDKKLAGEIADHYFEAVHVSEAKATKFKNDYRDRVRALNLSTKVQKGNDVSEAHAVQLLGEAMDNIRVMENARGRMVMRDGKTLAEWRAVVDDLWINNPGLDRQKVERAVEEFRKIYDELFQQMNRIRVENGYEPVNYRQGYFPHFQPGGDGIMAFFGKVMGINTQVDAMPTTINGLTHTFKPGIQWFGNAQERIGFNTAYDAVEGFDRYIEGVASVIYQTENIQKLRALATQVRYRTSDEGIRKQVDAVRMDNRLTEEEKQREINSIYEHGRFSLSNFVAELDEYTNLLANKKSKYDRTMESLIGRRAYTVMKAWENRVGANMIAGNLTSALTNFIPLTQAGAQLDSGMILKGMWDTLMNMWKGNNVVVSDFLTNRRGSDPLVKTWMQKASGLMGTPMEFIDNFTSESIVRAAYQQNLKRGLSEKEAMHQADIFAAGVMADRSKGSMPTLFESRNPLFKAFTQFQLEVNNQFSEVFKDLPRNHREKGLAVLAGILLKYFLGAWVYNELFEKLIGRRSALDPIGILNQTVGDLTGYEIPNLFEMAGDLISGEEISFETEKVGIGEAGSNLATTMLGELPFSAGLTMLGIETDGGRVPAASAIPDLSALWEAATTEGWTGEQRWKHIQDELNKLAYVLPPFGGGQISKSWKGIDAYLQGGSYGMDKNGEEILQYPVYKDEPEDAFWSLVRAAFLGKTSLPEAQNWVETGYSSLNAYQTAVYKDLLDTGVKDRDAYDLIDGIRNIDATESGEERAAGRRLIARSDLSAEGKAIAFYGLVATDKERDWMNQLVDAGADQADTMAFVSNLYDADKKKGTEKKQAQYVEFLDAPLTDDEKKVAVGFLLGTDLEYENGNPTQYAKFLSALETGLSVDKYMEIRATETDIEDYLELTDVGIKGEKAADLAIAIDALEPADGYDSVTWIQRCNTIVESNLSETEQMAALETVMYESTYEKVKAGHNFGMNVKSYIDLKSIMPEFDANGNGSYSQQETEDAINALAGDDNVLYALTGTTPNGYTLTDKEKAILWQLQNKSWKPNRNPFDREVGQMVYDYLTAENSAQTSTTAENGATIDLSNLFAKIK